jgi:putative ABC transport system permease protein
MKLHEFKMISQMSFRNLSRHRVKTIITAIAIVVSVALYIFTDSWLKGMNIESKRNIVSYEIGAAKIQSPAYFNKKDDLPMYENFGNWEKISKTLKDAGYDSSPRFVFSGTIYSRTGSAPAVFNAVDVEADKRLFRYADYIEAGTFPEPGTRTVVIGQYMAEKLHVGVPHRPDRDEYVDELLAAASNDEEKSFIESLYVPFQSQKKKNFAQENESDKTRMALRQDVTKDEMNRLWKILSRTGRMDVRISTTIDIKALPDKILEEKFERDLFPMFTGEKRHLLLKVYQKDKLLGDYFLNGATESEKEMILSTLLENNYTGAIRHVNQLIDAVVVGVVNSPNPKNNANVGYIPIDSMQDESGLLLEGNVTEILIRKIDAKDSNLPGKFESSSEITKALLNSPVKHLFEGENPRLKVYQWSEYVSDYFAAAQGDQVSTRVMIFFLFLLSFIGIANTMLMAILERTKEIGMMRALGMSDTQLLVSYVMEASMVGIIGGIIGVIIGCLINIPMVEYGIDYSEMMTQMGGDIGYRIAARFRSTWNFATIIGTFIVAVLLSGAMAIIPTLRALKMPVTDSLRFE